VNTGGPPLDVREINFENQRSVAKHPQLLVVGELVHELVDKRRICGHTSENSKVQPAPMILHLLPP
jgi:hypothetical protein